MKWRMNRKMAGWVLGVAHIAFFLGLACADIGEVRTAEPKPYTWRLPVAILSIVLPPFILGHMAGGEE